MCYWKQWRFCRTKVRNLLKIGVSLNAAISVGMSRKGPWRLSRTLATQTGMSKIPPSGTNQWLKDQVLISIKELWVDIYPPLADSLSGDSPIGFMKRTGELVPSKSRETRMRCGVGGGSCEVPPYPDIPYQRLADFNS
jgi:hypothetical protein